MQLIILHFTVFDCGRLYVQLMEWHKALFAMGYIVVELGR